MSISQNESITKDFIDSIEEFGDSINGATENLIKLKSYVNMLHDNTLNQKILEETINQLSLTNSNIKKMISLERKLHIKHLSYSNIPQGVKLMKAKLAKDMHVKLDLFNELSRSIDRLIDQNSAMGVRANKQASSNNLCDFDQSADNKNQSINDCTINHNSVTFIPNLDNEIHVGVQNVKANLESTQLIFDELDCLVKQQSVHLNTMENAIGHTKNFTKDTVHELNIAYEAKQKRLKRLWACMTLFVIMVLMIMYNRRVPGRVIESPSLPNLTASQPDNLRGYITSNIYNPPKKDD